MQESVTSFHNLEWPAPEARVAGPVVWLRGWVTGKPGFDFTDVRVAVATGLHLGVLGLPRTDLAAHFKSPRPWLPAEFVIGVPLPDGPATLLVEAKDESGNWHPLQSISLTVAADGERSSRVEGEVLQCAGGSFTTRIPHQPFHGHLDQPAAAPIVRDGRIEVFGWLLHETQRIRAVFATLDGLVFNALACGLTDESLATKLPRHAAARHARVRGGVDAPPTLSGPACLRVYAELEDGSVQLCFARRVEPSSGWNPAPQALSLAAKPANPSTGVVPAVILPLPSGRPRRLLLIARTLQPDDATLRALDVVRHLLGSGRWAARLVASEDGPLRAEFETSGCAVQLVDPRAFFGATQSNAADTALHQLDREIWWKHLDGVVIFDPASTWAGRLAQQKRLRVFEDPSDSLAWYAPAPVFAVDEKGDVVAPIRGLAAQGAGLLLHATRHFNARRLIVTDVRDTTEESLFQADWSRDNRVAIFPPMTPGSLWLRAVSGKGVLAAAAVICPVFSGHPHRALLSALAAGVPLVTTPSPLICATFGANEISYVPAGNPLALAHALTDTLANPAARDRRTAAAARLVQATHTPALQLSQWEKLMEAALGG